jgi:hypothetical protein
VWLKKLQIAIVEKNPEAISELVSNMPEFKSVDEMKSASALIKESLKLLTSMKEDTRKTLLKLKKHKEFLSSEDLDFASSRLDINS